MDLLPIIKQFAPQVEVVASFDYETYYADDYTLSKMTTESYIRDPRFQTIGVGVKMMGERVWMEHHEFAHWSKRVDWSRVALIAHHAHFDGAIANWHYDVRPGFWIDTLSLARIFVPVDVGGSLKKLATYFQIGVKGEEVVLAKNKRRQDFTPEEYVRYGGYCLNDCDLTDGLAQKMVEHVPPEELVLIDMTVRAFTEPVFEIDCAMAVRFIEYEKNRKAELLARVAADKSVLMSNDKFAALLIEMGIDPPMKVSAPKLKKAIAWAQANGVDPGTIEEEDVSTYAFAKTDIGMQELLEHERDEIRWLAEARVGVKSTINETRAQRFLNMGMRGLAALYLKYSGAHTYRFSGGDKLNPQNLQRSCTKHDERDESCADCWKGTLRAALVAPGRAA